MVYVLKEKIISSIREPNCQIKKTTIIEENLKMCENTSEINSQSRNCKDTTKQIHNSPIFKSQ